MSANKKMQLDIVRLVKAFEDLRTMQEVFRTEYGIEFVSPETKRCKQIHLMNGLPVIAEAMETPIKAEERSKFSGATFGTVKVCDTDILQITYAKDGEFEGARYGK